MGEEFSAGAMTSMRQIAEVIEAAVRLARVRSSSGARGQRLLSR